MENSDVNIALAQAVELPDFSGLPGYAQGILYAVLAVGLALSVIIPRFGFLFGKEAAKGATAPNATVAAVVVDPTALNRHSDAIIKLAEEMGELKVELRIVREVGLKLRRDHN
jgi:hypothetical protein